MSDQMPDQSAANHARFVPGYHYLGGPLVLGNLIWAAIVFVRHTTATTGMHLLMGVILLVLFYYVRTFPLAVQDRLIRLEERLRLSQLLPADLQPRINEFTAKQLIAMRFASDAELPALAQRVLNDNLHDGKAIKTSVKMWRADHLRA
jgi:hypothetical protein